MLTEFLVDTGEEGEEVYFSTRAKLYFFAGKDGWKDRGTGVIKVNVRTISDEVAEGDVEAQQSSSGKRKARLLMRADATHRVILNTPIFKGMRFGDADSSEPTGKVMHLQSLEDGKPLPLQIKVCTLGSHINACLFDPIERDSSICTTINCSQTLATSGDPCIDISFTNAAS